MRSIARTATVLGLVCLAQVPSLFAQSTGFDKFAWYLGAQGGMSILFYQQNTDALQINFFDDVKNFLNQKRGEPHAGFIQ